MDKFLQALNFLKRRVYFPDGLVVMLLLAGAIWERLHRSLQASILDILQKRAHLVSTEISTLIHVGGFLLVAILVIGVWFSVRSVRKFSANQIGILFAPSYSTELSESVERIFVNLSMALKASDLFGKFHLYRVPPQIIVDSPQKAADMIRKARGIAMVWGAIESGDTGQGRTTGFSRISFTFVHRPVPIRLSRIQSLATMLGNSKWQLNDRTITLDTSVLARNMSLIVRYVISFSLFTNQKFIEAAQVLGPLLADLSAIRPGTSNEERRVIVQIKSDFALCLTFSTSAEYMEYLERRELFAIPRDTRAKWLQNVDNAISLDPQNSSHFLSKAIYSFLLGETEIAFKAAYKAKNLSPHAFAVPNYSLAFLYIFAGDFQKALAEYKRAFKRKTSYDERLIRQLILFIDQCADQFPDRPQLRFSLGYIKFSRGDSQQGKRELEQFLKDNQNREELSVLADATREILTINRF